MVDLVKAGHYGIKTKRGFYEWTDEKITAEKVQVLPGLDALYQN
jgi:3-hydroxyacyl-CoA dehydrogenase